MGESREFPFQHLEDEEPQAQAQTEQEGPKEIDTWRATGTETMYTSLASNPDVHMTVEYVQEQGGIGAVDKSRPRIGDVDVVQERLEEEEHDAETVNDAILEDDPKRAREEARVGIAKTKETIEAAHEESEGADVMQEFIRVFTREMRSRLLRITGGADSWEMPNRGAFDQAAKSGRAFAVPDGAKADVLQMLNDVAANHFVAGSKETFMSRGMQFAPEDFISEDTGFIITAQSGDTTENLYFLYASAKKEQKEAA